MKKVVLFLLCLIFINTVEEYFKSGVYNLFLNKKKYLVFKNNKLTISKSRKCEEKSNFRLTKLNGDEYYIEFAKDNFKLSLSNGKIELISEENNEKDKWSFVESGDKKYAIKNKNNCFITLNNNDIKCRDSNIKNALKFSLEIIYEEVNHTPEDLKLIENEPVDVLIKYIDLSDPTLVREGIPQIVKDENNEELKYNVRGILKNIPWARKIFILMPNKRVKYFKDYDLIKEKIIYVYDKDLIGYDSSNSLAFQYRYWMMEKFNMSENFILMDDDYFIGKPLKKSDFFYVENGRVVPAIVTRIFTEINLKSIQKDRKYLKIIKNLKRAQSTEHFMYSMDTAYLLTLKTLRSPLVIPKFTHNAIPCNTKDVKELYDIVYNSEFKYSTLDALFRHDENVQFQTFLLAYTFSKYNKKVSSIEYAYIDNNDSLHADYSCPLFCINTGSDGYTKLSFMKSRLVLENIFSEPSPYEIFNYSYVPSLAKNIIIDMETEMKEEKEKEKKCLRISLAFYAYF